MPRGFYPGENTAKLLEPLLALVESEMGRLCNQTTPELGLMVDAQPYDDENGPCDADIIILRFAPDYVKTKRRLT